MQSLWAYKRRHPHSAVRCNYQSQAHFTVCDPSDSQRWLMTLPGKDSLRSGRWTTPPLSFLLNFLPPKVLSISIPAQAPMWPSVFRYKAIDNLDHQAVMAGLAYHSQSRLYHFTLPCRAKKYDSLSAGGRKGWALESCRRGGEGLIWHSSLGLP